jgi:photosystem II stability/assembly factor-like uncharacterized protein
MKVRRILGFATLALVITSSLPRTGAVLAASGQASPVRGVLFAGLDDGTLYRSTDGGVTWQESDSGLPSGTGTTALAVATGGTTIYAGTQINGVFISTNGGTSWQDDNADDATLGGDAIAGLVVDPANGQNVSALTGDDHFYASTDGGADWTTTSLPAGSQATALALNPKDPQMLLAGTQGDGIFLSTDGGADWDSTSDGSLGAVNALAFNPRNPQVAFAATSSGMYQTIDGGNSWEVAQRGIPGGTSFQSVAVDPSNGARIIAGTTDGQFYRSQDGGTSWSFQGVALDNGAIDSIVFDPARDNAILGGSDYGNLYRSDDSGTTWNPYSDNLGYLSGHSAINVLATSGSAPLPTDPVPAPQGNPYGVRYFSQTHHTVRGPFLSFYNKYGSLKIFGLPLTEQFTDGGHLVQYFERSELIFSNGRITLASLGSQLTAGRSFAPVGCCPPEGQLWFSQTRHTLSGLFLSFWRSHNGSLIFGYPISQPLYEQNGDGTGRTYLVQYFQKARLEYHPELAGTGSEVTLGLLGRQVLQQRGWL